jgi:hypothetical protein
MRALVDDLQFENLSEGGTVVTLSKTLALHPASMLHRLGLAGDRSRVQTTAPHEGPRPVD